MSPTPQKRTRIELTTPQLQVLARLVELQFSEADSYPCNIDMLVAACEDSNVHSTLQPLVRSEVHDAITGLIRGRLIRVEQPEEEFLYQHNASETLHVGPAQLALLTALILQGPQAPSQLLKNAYRLFPFSSATHLKETLDSLQQGRKQVLIKTIKIDEPEPIYCQALCPELSTQIRTTAETGDSADKDTLEDLATRVEELESIVQRLSGSNNPTDN